MFRKSLSEIKSGFGVIMEIRIFKLNLTSSLHFNTGEDEIPFSYDGKAEGVSNSNQEKEKLFCLELDEKECVSFEPDKGKLFGAGLFKPAQELPHGDYIFAQKREILNYGEATSFAIEIQMEGLWQRFKLGEKLYLRYLYEDGKSVTQLFRPYKQ